MSRREEWAVERTYRIVELVMIAFTKVVRDGRVTTCLDRTQCTIVAKREIAASVVVCGEDKGQTWLGNKSVEQQTSAQRVRTLKECLRKEQLSGRPMILSISLSLCSPSLS